MSESTWKGLVLPPGIEKKIVLIHKMGNTFQAQSWCVDQETILKLQYERDKVRKQKDEIVVLQAQTEELVRDRERLQTQTQELQARIQELQMYKTVFESPDEMAQYVMSTDLNLKWMDDKEEKDYLVSLIRFMNNFAEESIATSKRDSLQ